LRRPRDQDDARAAACGLGRNRIPHLAARSIAEVSHGIDVFESGSGRDQHESAEQRATRLQEEIGGLDDLVRLGQASLANPAAGKISGSRIHEPDAARGERRQVPPHGFVLEHVGVHRRRHQDRRTRGEIERAQEIISDAVGELADDVRGRRRHQQQRDIRGQRDVLDVGIHPGGILIGDDATPGYRLECERADELRGGPRHHRGNIVAALLQPSRNFDGFVRADPTGYAQGYQCHGGCLTLRVGVSRPCLP
jgi:hypothetical protein